MLIGQTGPNVFLAAKLCRMGPDLAVQLGEHLTKEGQRLKSGLVLPG